MVTRVSEVKGIVQKGTKNPREAFSEIRKLAESEDWKVREVAATALGEKVKERNRHNLQADSRTTGLDDRPPCRRVPMGGVWSDSVILCLSNFLRNIIRFSASS